MYKNITSDRAFTLVELIVVISIVGILTGIAVPGYTNFIKDAKVSAMLIDTEVLSSAAMIQDIKTDLLPEKAGDVLISEELSNTLGVNDASEVISLIDENQLSHQIKSLSGDYTDYGIITRGNCRGRVLHLKGVEDGKGSVIHSAGKSLENCDFKTKEEQEIDNLINQGYIPIASAKELNNIRSNSPKIFGVGTIWENEYTPGLKSKYIQVSDIDLSNYSNNYGWSPIGKLLRANPSKDTSFTGIYDGNGFNITGLRINVSGNNYVGLFGSVDNAVLKNIRIVNAEVDGGSQVGILVGYALNNSTIESSYVSGVVKGNGEKIGGLVGDIESSSAIDSHSEVDVNSSGDSEVANARKFIGGFAGMARSSTINNSSSSGKVIGTYRNIGGFIGEMRYDSEVNKSFSSSAVEGNAVVGGLVGSISESTVRNSYTTGSVNATGQIGGFSGHITNKSKVINSYAVGPLFGRYATGGFVSSFSNSEINNSFWDIDSTGMSSSPGGVGRNTVDMKKRSTYKGWDFDNIWEINENSSYPTLR